MSNMRCFFFTGWGWGLSSAVRKVGDRLIKENVTLSNTFSNISLYPPCMIKIDLNLSKILVARWGMGARPRKCEMSLVF